MSQAAERSLTFLGLDRPIGSCIWPGAFFNIRKPLGVRAGHILSFDLKRSWLVSWRGVYFLGAVALLRRLENHLDPGSEDRQSVLA